VRDHAANARFKLRGQTGVQSGNLGYDLDVDARKATQ
jgi:hypothetical protein